MVSDIPPPVDGGQPKNFLRACLLLLLRDAPAHGYDLLERLREFTFDRDAGGLYRALRALEHEGLVTSTWAASYSGPDRRTYALSAHGELALDGWARALRDTHNMLGVYLERYAAGSPVSVEP